jgi:hypothetical protein
VSWGLARQGSRPGRPDRGSGLSSEGARPPHLRLQPQRDRSPPGARRAPHRHLDQHHDGRSGPPRPPGPPALAPRPGAARVLRQRHAGGWPGPLRSRDGRPHLGSRRAAPERGGDHPRPLRRGAQPLARGRGGARPRPARG